MLIAYSTVRGDKLEQNMSERLTRKKSLNRIATLMSPKKKERSRTESVNAPGSITYSTVRGLSGRKSKTRNRTKSSYSNGRTHSARNFEHSIDTSKRRGSKRKKSSTLKRIKSSPNFDKKRRNIQSISFDKNKVSSFISNVRKETDIFINNNPGSRRNSWSDRNHNGNSSRFKRSDSLPSLSDRLAHKTNWEILGYDSDGHGNVILPNGDIVRWGNHNGVWIVNY
eukprot:TRINITY_DN3758_c0_g1_i4.p1 TRINITY_DN3758_c0_g1~~TRINITY_DN3758_c0_g1_i4.p1  ORF type:complete len:225 (-),score=33.75 TRINITY_DN3758_c0_g1_i4:59-733(-)